MTERSTLIKAAVAGMPAGALSEIRAGEAPANVAPTGDTVIPSAAPIVVAPQAPAAPPIPAVSPNSVPGEANPWDEVKRLDAERIELKKAIKTMQSQLATLSAPAVSVGGLTLEQLKADPLGILKQAGLRYEDLTERVIKGGGPTVDDALAEARATRAQATADAQAVRDELVALRNGLTQERMSIDAMRVITASPKFELLQADPDQAIREAFSKMAEHHQATGEALTWPTVLATVQTEWVDKLKKLDSHKAASKALGLSGTVAPLPTQSVVSPTAVPAKSKPLTNDVTASPANSSAFGSVPSQGIDRAEYIRQAVRRLVPPSALGE